MSKKLQIGIKVRIKGSTWKGEEGIIEQIQYEQGQEIYMVRFDNRDLFPDLVPYRKEQLDIL